MHALKMEEKRDGYFFSAFSAYVVACAVFVSLDCVDWPDTLSVDHFSYCKSVSIVDL